MPSVKEREKQGKDAALGRSWNSPAYCNWGFSERDLQTTYEAVQISGHVALRSKNPNVSLKLVNSTGCTVQK